MQLSPQQLKKLLDSAYNDFHSQHRRDRDPVSFVHRFKDPADQELVAFLTALLSYGNVKSILVSAQNVLDRLGPSPSRAVREAELAGKFDGFYHRFTRGVDIEILCFWMRATLETHGSLNGAFVSAQGELSTKDRLSHFVQILRRGKVPSHLSASLKKRERNLKYLLSDPAQGSACKRLNMFLRWMVRPADGIDTGLWSQVSARELILPIDTHLLKTIRHLGWTRSKSANWRVAEHATAKLRELSPEDPLRYDFSLCHLSMAGKSVKAYMEKKMSSWNNDPFTKKARQQNYLARSVFKLKEIEEKEKILSGAKNILDLGASPGSWTQYCIERVPKAQIIAIDLSPLRFQHPNVRFIQKPIEEMDWEEEGLPTQYDIVLSDMAPKTSGVHDQDVARSFDLALIALEVAKERLRPGGHFVAKLFMGDTFEEFNSALKEVFTDVRRTRPDSTRKHSREIFFIGKNKR